MNVTAPKHNNPCNMMAFYSINKTRVNYTTAKGRTERSEITAKIIFSCVVMCGLFLVLY